MSEMLPNSKTLETKLASETLTPPEVIEGIRECFVLSYREFMQRHQNGRSVDELDTISESLVQGIFNEAFNDPGKVSTWMLNHMVTRLGAFIEFDTDPEIAERYDQMIDDLLSKLKVMPAML